LSSSMYVEFRHWQPVHMSPWISLRLIGELLKFPLHQTGIHNIFN
jgi:hypothetical protein